MTTTQHTFSFMLRNSGEVLSEVEHADVRLSRRDGSDVLLVTESREDSIRDSLDITIRVIDRVLESQKLRSETIGAFVEAHPWVGWLSKGDREEFVDSFIATTKACRATGGYGPLEKLLRRWKASAQIVHNPELAALLIADRGEDQAVILRRPR